MQRHCDSGSGGLGQRFYRPPPVLDKGHLVARPTPVFKRTHGHSAAPDSRNEAATGAPHTDRLTGPAPPVTTSPVIHSIHSELRIRWCAVSSSSRGSCSMPNSFERERPAPDRGYPLRMISIALLGAVHQIWKRLDTTPCDTPRFARGAGKVRHGCHQTQRAPMSR